MTVFLYVVLKKGLSEKHLYVLSHNYIILILTLLPTSSHFQEV